MKTNFRNNDPKSNETLDDNNEKELSKEEFEKFIVQSGAKGSFMVYRSQKKDDELGIDEL